MPKFTPDKLGFGQPNATGTSVSGNPGLSASGGSINDYQSPDGNFYRAHIFYGSGELTVTSAGKYGNNIEFLVVAGGGGGGSNTAPDMGPRAGGGAGGLRTNAAPIASPSNLSLTPNVTTCSMASCSIRTLSISSGDTFSPPRLIISFNRPEIFR